MKDTNLHTRWRTGSELLKPALVTLHETCCAAVTRATQMRTKLITVGRVTVNNGNVRIVYYIATIFVKYWHTIRTGFTKRPEGIL